ncbi:MAG: hypothetical protein M3Z64_05165 [Verrucomicrobiota bacterium]|nr:hypothetical protein [Verrucomicrobiota bacterium]
MSEHPPAEAPHLNTTAQKPDALTAGAPLTPPADHADADHESPTPGARTPFEKPAELTEPHHVAAGIPAIYQTTRFAIGEMGLVRGATTLLSSKRSSAVGQWA